MTVQVPPVLTQSNGTGLDSFPVPSLSWSDPGDVEQELTFFTAKEEWPDQGTDIADHPVEIGADVSDHIREHAPKCTLAIVATLAPLASSQWATAAVQALQIDPPPGSSMRPTIVSTLQFHNTFGVDPVQQLIETLLALKSAGTLFVMHSTKQGDVPNMAIEELSYVRDDEGGTGAMITLGLKQLRFVQTQIVNAPIPAYPRAATPVDKGQQDPTDGDNEEQASAAEDWFGDPFGASQ